MVVTIYSKMVWKEVSAFNIIGVLEGQLKDDVIVVSAHYDSWSIAPDISYAAEDSVSISALLEIARYFVNYKPLNTIWFVAYSGHYQDLQGPMEWVNSVLLNTTKRIWVQIGIDLSSESPSIDLLYVSPYIATPLQVAVGYVGGVATVGATSFATSSTFQTRFAWITKNVDVFLSPIVNVVVDMLAAKGFIIDSRKIVSYNFIMDSWWGTQPDFYMLDTEPSEPAGSCLVRMLYDSPFYWLFGSAIQ